ncbi:hypothetical protein BC829DRAFT_55629 [Chytridium lagenaria]|nr:hypothetical protein BC829DRAFT_55629 [Chytridium lagenaria]
MSAAERDAYIAAVRRLRQVPSVAGRASLYIDLVSIHTANMGYTHMAALFFPWHRAYLQLYEKYLRQVNPTVSIPFWDWSADAPQPLKNGVNIAQIFGTSSSSFGTVGTDRNGYCLTNGFAAGWLAQDGSCLSRSYGPSFSVPNPIDVAIAVQRSPSYKVFSGEVEYFHNYVHYAVGGDNGMLTWSDFAVNDPIFWSHHSNVDRLWYSWQQLNPTLQAQYSGSVSLPTGSSETAKSTDIMPAFNYPVSATLILGKNGFCSGYDALDRTRLTRRDPIEALNRRMIQGGALLPWMDQSLFGTLNGALREGRQKLGSGKYGTVKLPPFPALKDTFLRRNMGKRLFGKQNTPDEEREIVGQVRAMESVIETNRNSFITSLDDYFEEHPHADYEEAFERTLNSLKIVEPFTLVEEIKDDASEIAEDTVDGTSSSDSEGVNSEGTDEDSPQF